MPQRAIRHRNATRIFHAIRSRPGATQREIVAMAGADKSTVSTVLRQFESRSLIERIEIASRGGRGRPSEGYRISTSGGVVIGVHLSPTELRFVLADMSGRTRGVLSRPMSAASDQLGRDMAAGIAGLLVSANLGDAKLQAVGLSVPGLVETGGRVRHSPNLAWSDFNPLELLRAQVDFPVFIGNDANGTTLAEIMFGRPPDESNFLLLLSGSGVGGGIVIGGSLMRGDHGLAGEFGHHKIHVGGRLCRCGSRGCLSAYVSNYSLVSLAHEAGLKVAGFEDVVGLLKSRDAGAAAVIEDYADNLGLGISNMVTVLGIGHIVLSGGFRVLLPYIADLLEKSLTKYAHPAQRPDIRISASVTGTSDVPLAGIAIALDGCTGMAAVDSAPWSAEPRKKGPKKPSRGAASAAAARNGVAAK